MKAQVLFLSILLISAGVFAQPRCGFDEVHQQMLSQDPAYLQRVTQMNNQWGQTVSNSSTEFVTTNASGIFYEIPVVIHVIHTGNAVGGQYNPSDAQLSGMLDYLNQTYAATYASYPNTSNGGVYFPVKFVLAKRSPTCGSTTGIVRVPGTGVSGYSTDGITSSNEVAVKALSKWSNTDYYNIWIVSKIEGADGTVPNVPFVAGYAYFPGAGASVDGTVMLASQAVAGAITLPHEIGHAFSLYHTFEGDGTGATCPPTTPCATTGDLVCDTEPHKRSPYNCPSGTNTCTGSGYNNVVNNFMDYSSCQNRFTAGQKTRFLNGLLTSRPALAQSVAGNTLVSLTASSCTITGVTVPANTANMGPTGVSLSNLSYSSNGYNNEGNAYYLDRSCYHQANVVSGQQYTLAVTTATNAQDVAVWIDYNNDGAFTVAERVYYHTGTMAAETHSTTITIPSTAVTCLPLRMRVAADWASAPDIPATGCGMLAYGQAEDYAVNIVPGPTTLTNAITSGANPSCAGSQLIFTASASPAVSSAAYTWYVNNVQAATGSTYTTSSIANGSTVYARVDYTVACGSADSAFSNTITVTRSTAVIPSVSITTPATTICAGTIATFTATPVNGGTAPSYQWQVNGANVGSNSSTYTSTALANGNIVKTILTSNAACPSPTTATSNSIAMTVLSTGTWRGLTSTAWLTASNWCGGVPGATTDVVIPASAPFMPTLNTTTTVNSFTNNGNMTVGPSGLLTVQ